MSTENCHQAALDWLQFGLQVIPVPSGTKRTALKWDPWLKDLSPDKIDNHWKQYPDHELGFIVGNDLLVVDADDPMAVAADAVAVRGAR